MSGYCVIPITRNQTRIHHFGRRCGVTLLITAVLSQNKGVFSALFHSLNTPDTAYFP